MSETPLDEAAVAVYNNGGTYQGVTVVAPGATPAAGQYANHYGEAASTLDKDTTVWIADPNNPGQFIQSTTDVVALMNDAAITNDIYAAGSEGVSAAVDYETSGVAGRIGYVGPDYVAPYATNVGSNTYNLASARLVNAAGRTVSLTPANATTGYTLAAPATDADRANPAKWVASPSAYVASGASFVKNPVAIPAATTAYPIVGTSNFLLYTCYSSPAKVNSLALNNDTDPQGFVTWYFRNAITESATNGILAKAGLAPLPSGVRSAIIDSFINGSVNGGALKIGSSATCSGKVGG